MYSPSSTSSIHDAFALPEMLGRAREGSVALTAAESHASDDPADLIALLHAHSPTYMQTRRGRGASSASSLPPTPPIPSPVHDVHVQPSRAVVSPPTAPPADAGPQVQQVAGAADAALASAACPAKAAIFVTSEAAASLLAETLGEAQLACGTEARVKLSGKRRQHLSVHALDEAALERSLVATVLRLCERADELQLEIRWLLRGPPMRATPQLLQRWQEAVDASQQRFPLRSLEVGLVEDQSCVRLLLHCDGWYAPATRARSPLRAGAPLRLRVSPPLPAMPATSHLTLAPRRVEHPGKNGRRPSSVSGPTAPPPPPSWHTCSPTSDTGIRRRLRRR